MAYITRELELYIPKREDLWFYQQMMADPETMSYNAEMSRSASMLTSNAA